MSRSVTGRLGNSVGRSAPEMLVFVRLLVYNWLDERQTQGSYRTVSLRSNDRLDYGYEYGYEYEYEYLREANFEAELFRSSKQIMTIVLPLRCVAACHYNIMIIIYQNYDTAVIVLNTSTSTSTSTGTGSQSYECQQYEYEYQYEY